MKDTLFNETIPYFLQRFNGIAEKNNGYLAVQRVKNT